MELQAARLMKLVTAGVIMTLAYRMRICFLKRLNWDLILW